MSVSIVIGQRGSSQSSRAQAWLLLLPLALLLGPVGLYVWAAPRGFEFTDESYYVLSYLGWRSAVGTATFFGAFFELPFLWLGQSIPGMRLLSLGLLLLSGAYAMREATRFDGGDPVDRHAKLLCLMLGASSSLFYFGHFSNLRAPSYNLLALCSMLVATGFLLRFVEGCVSSKADRVAMFGYGIAVAVCVLSKVSSGGLLIAAHLCFMAVLNRDWTWRRLFEVFGLVVTGFVLVFALLQFTHPTWLSVFREGVLWARTTDSSYGLPSLINALRWDMQRQALALLPWATGLGAMSWLAVRLRPGRRRQAASVWVVVLVSGCSAGLLVDGWAYLWLPLTAGAALSMMLMQRLSRTEGLRPVADARSMALTVLLLALPLLFSFGTNGRVLAHSMAAAAFAIIAIAIGLLRLFQLGLITRLALVVSFAALCVPPLVVQVRVLLDVKHNYRQISALGQQRVPVALGPIGNTLQVDTGTHITLQALQDAARTAGLAPGQLIQDFTGDGSGLVYALGGKPLAVAWMGGGYLGSRQAAERLLSLVAPASLRSAWLLTSATNPRAISGWQQMVDARAGADSHVRVATVRIQAPYKWVDGAPEIVDVQIWKPRQIATPMQ